MMVLVSLPLQGMGQALEERGPLYTFPDGGCCFSLPSPGAVSTAQSSGGCRNMGPRVPTEEKKVWPRSGTSCEHVSHKKLGVAPVQPVELGDAPGKAAVLPLT